MPQRRGTTPVSDTEIIYSPETYLRGVPHDHLARLRARTPVVWVPGRAGAETGLWAVLRHPDVRYVLDHPQIFAPGPALPLGTWVRRCAAEVRTRRRPAAAPAPHGAARPGTDGTGRAVALLDRVTGRGGADLVGEIMAGLPGPIRDAVSGGVFALLRHPDQYARLRRDRDLLSAALEEMLRWWSPVLQVRRTVRRDTVLGGVPLRAGEQVAAWLAAANHDDEVFDDPGRFDIERRPARHLAFGEGSGHCSAAAPARAQMKAIITAVLDRPDLLELADRPLRLRSTACNGFARLPLRPAGRAPHPRRHEPGPPGIPPGE